MLGARIQMVLAIRDFPCLLVILYPVPIFTGCPLTRGQEEGTQSWLGERTPLLNCSYSWSLASRFARSTGLGRALEFHVRKRLAFNITIGNMGRRGRNAGA